MRVRNPFASEGAAFRFLLLTVGAFSAVAVAALVAGGGAAIAVWVAASAAAVLAYVRRGRPVRVLRTAPAHVGPSHERRFLVLAGTPLPDAVAPVIRQHADSVFLVSQPMPGRLHRWVSDVDSAREDARRLVEASLSELGSANADPRRVRGAVGDEDPLQSIEDALRTFGADEIIVAGGRGPLDAAAVARIRERFALPVTELA